MTYENVLKFKVKWRSYQARVLENSRKYMADGKIHIGAGRTGERSKEQLQNELDKKGACLKIIGDYKGMITPFMISSGCNDKYWWKCSCCGWEWKTAVCDRTLAGKECKKCANRLRAVYQMKSQAEFEEEIKEKLPDIEIIGNYSGTHEKIEVLCKKCGYKWSTYPSTLLRGRGCTKCYDYKKTNKKKTHEEFINEMAVIQPNLIFLEEYQCRTQKIRAKCKICNEEFTPRPADLLHGHYKKHIHDEKNISVKGSSGRGNNFFKCCTLFAVDDD